MRRRTAPPPRATAGGLSAAPTIFVDVIVIVVDRLPSVEAAYRTLTMVRYCFIAIFWLVDFF
jgi:hypothetical protein